MRPHALLSAFVALFLGGCATSSNWPQFRGPTGQGVAEVKGVPLQWTETQHVKWKTPIHGKAWSSPVVWGEQVWLSTATEDGRELFGVCVDRRTGKILFDQRLFTIATPQYADRFNSYGSPTPVIEDGRVYLTFGSAGTACLDTATFKVLWERTDLPCNHYRGAGSSPTLWRNLLIMHFDGSDVQYITALDKLTGKTVWKTDRSIDFQDLTPEGKPIRDGDFRKGFSSPLVIEHEGQPLLISSASKATYGYEPASGKELWRVEERKHHSGSVRPVYGHGLIFAATGLGKGEMWAIRPGGRGVVTDTHVVWKVAKGAPNRPSPVLVGEWLFMLNQDGGVVTCLEAKTGRVIWSERLPGLGNYSASPVLAAGRLYFCNENGQTTVIEAGPQFKVLAENILADGFMASPAVAGKALYLRSKTALYRIEE
ncbi:outer membrane protein assembly factor BamB family protein [Horticoccus sp. 23ND18S-11]|uniref:outer membrane protein assembly factor BamB family protein n=1 Tax=Horticoccus sp. 23ND18S-11 TaxID=3391832 RepID=UPI0039C8DEB0